MSGVLRLRILPFRVLVSALMVGGCAVLDLDLDFGA